MLAGIFAFHSTCLPDYALHLLELGNLMSAPRLASPPFFVCIDCGASWSFDLLLNSQGIPVLGTIGARASARLLV